MKPTKKLLFKNVIITKINILILERQKGVKSGVEGRKEEEGRDVSRYEDLFCALITVPTFTTTTTRVFGGNNLTEEKWILE